MFALSTAWNADRVPDGEKIAREIFELGFKKIELNFSLDRTMVEEIERFCRQQQIEITSLHNFCPTPEGIKRQDALPDCFSLSSIDEAERKKAVEYTKITIETAKKLSAKAVVLHCGRVEIKDQTRQLIGLASGGQRNSKAYQEILNDFILERNKNSTEYFNQILKSLKTLADYAQRSEIVLGIENRFYYREIPSLEEFQLIFDQFKNKPLAYWHDTGHSYIMEQLGLMPQGALLKNYGSRLYGIHLHNIKDLEDHQAPIEGDFDFHKIKSYIRPETLKVIEAHSQATPEAIKKSVSYLSEVLNA